MDVERYKTLSLPIAIALLILLLGILMHIMKWPFAFEIKLLSFLTVGFLYGTRFNLKTNKTFKDRVKAYVVFSFTMVEVLTMLKIEQARYIFYFGLLCGMIWMIIEINHDFRKKYSSIKPNYFLIAGLMCLIYYVLSRFLSWPISLLSQIFGISLTSIGFFIAHLRFKKTQENSRIY